MSDPAWLLAAHILNASAIALVFVLSWLVLARHPEAYFRWWVLSSGLAMVGGLASAYFLIVAPLRPLEFLLAPLMVFSSLALIACGRRYRGPTRSEPFKWGLGAFIVVAIWAMMLLPHHFALAAVPGVVMLSLSHLWFGWIFWPRRQDPRTLGGRLVSACSIGWGLHILDYPLLTLHVPQWLAVGFWVSAILQLGLGVGMIVHLFELSHERETALARQLSQTNQELLRTLGALTDSRSQAELTAAVAREQEALVRQIIHDLRNATQAMSLAVEEIEAAGGDATRQAHGLATLDRQVRFISNFLKEKLAWIVDRSAPSDKRTELPAAYESLGATMKTLAAAKGQALVVEPPPPVVLSVSPVQFEQLLGNLLMNAHQHCPSGATIRLWTAVSDGWATCYVGDDGPGIALEAQAQLGRSAPRADGTGVGLRNVQELVTAAGGLFGVVSDLGQGSTFYVTLPLVSWGRAVAAEASAALSA